MYSLHVRLIRADILTYFLPVRSYAAAGTSHRPVSLRLSVCLSVCLSCLCLCLSRAAVF